MLLRRHTTKPTSTPIDSTGPSSTKKGDANVTSYTLHCQTTATMISDQIHFFNSYYNFFSLTFSISSQTVHELNLHHCNLYLVRLKNPPFCRKSGKKATSLQEVQHSIWGGKLSIWIYIKMKRKFRDLLITYDLLITWQPVDNSDIICTLLLFLVFTFVHICPYSTLLVKNIRENKPTRNVYRSRWIRTKYFQKLVE